METHGNQTQGEEHMIYFERAQPHYLVWPALAFGIGDEFWIGICWLNLELGWRSGKEENT